MENREKSGVYAAVAKLDAMEDRLWDQPLTRDIIQRALQEEELRPLVLSHNKAA